MFGALRYDDTTNDHEHIKLSGPSGAEARGYTLLACESCRARKVSHSVSSILQAMPAFGRQNSFFKENYVLTYLNKAQM